MIENTELQALLDEFSQHFPKIDFSNVTSGYEQVEKLLVPHVNEFTAEQWEVILDCKYGKLFQAGIPHLNWRNEREYIIFEVIRNLKPCRTWHESWYDIQMYSVKMPCGVVLEIKVEEPISWSGSSRTHHRIKIASEFIPVPTHRAVILAVAGDTKAYIADQFAGTQDECENWVAKNVKGRYFKIMPVE